MKKQGAHGEPVAAEHAAHFGLMNFYEKFGFLPGTSAIGLIITDMHGKILSFNKSIADLIGATLEECKDKNVAELYADPADRKRLLEMLAESKKVQDFEVRVRRKDGKLRTVLSNVDAIELEGQPVLLTALYDITQYKHLMAKSKSLDQGFRTLFRNVPVGITVTDFDGNLIVSNNAIKELLGYTMAELRKVKAQNFYLDTDDRRRLIELTQKYGTVRDFETVMRHRDGHAVTVLINTDTIDFNGLQNVLLTSVRDISNLKHIEETLKQERDFSDAILDTAPSLIFVLDRKGHVIKFNHACEKITGRSAKKMEGTTLWDAPFNYPEITDEKIREYLSGDVKSHYEATWVSDTGQAHLIEWDVTLLRDSNDNLEFVVGAGIDVTHRKKAEEALQQANRELALQVNELKERTEEMRKLSEMGEQLQHCQTIAEACAVSAQYVKQICPNTNGALYLINSSRTTADTVESWGKKNYTKKTFDPITCWAIRCGREYPSGDGHPGLLCGHITGPVKSHYLCVPLLVNGEAIGILHLNDVETEPAASAMHEEHKEQLLRNVADHIALALSNLKLQNTLRQQSIRDALTGLYNRRYMEETMERELKRALRDNHSLGVVMFDIDHFKEFNDLHGHDAGDAMLRALGAFLNKSLRGGDIICRYGGEEFLVVLPGITPENARMRAEELREGVKELHVRHLGKLLPRCTLSLGVAVSPQHGTTVDALLKAADEALYLAKNEGRDRVIMAPDT
jgi:diguanylate cyclase (GGDEF)-like protein/PAS domain S-box-containing protein